MIDNLALNLALYRSKISQLRPGDCIACCGGGTFPKVGPVSLLIRAWTGSRFTHIMTVIRVFCDSNGVWDALVTQSTIDTVNGKRVSGVQTSLLSTVLTTEYSAKGDLAYGLRLMPALSALIDPAKLAAFAEQYNGIVPYDTWGYLNFGLQDIPFLSAIAGQKQNLNRQFCSAWWARIMLYFRVLSGVDFSLESPRRTVQSYLWQDAFQLWGPDTPLAKIAPDWNTIGRFA